LGIVFYDHFVVLLIERYCHGRVLPTRQSGAPPVRYICLDARSVAYLSLNAFNEYAFVMRLTYYLWRGGRGKILPWKLTQLTVWNTAIAMGIMFVSMDVLYAPLHHLLHLPALYPLIHKHHHRQHFPARGYLDAGNEHPIEHMIGVMCTWFAVSVAEALLPTCKLWLEMVKGHRSGTISEVGEFTEWIRGGGVHALTVFFFFQFHAALAMLNHSPYDVTFSLPLVGSSSIFGTDNKFMGGNFLKRLLTGQWFEYSVRHHEMHHRKFNCNYGQYCMFYDRWMGSFLEYEGPMTAVELVAKKKRLKQM